MNRSDSPRPNEFAVLTARHHDGFSLFDSPTNEFNLMNIAGVIWKPSSPRPAAPPACGLASTTPYLDWRYQG